MAILATTLLFRVTPAPVEDDTFATLLFDVRPTTTDPHHLLFDVTQVVGAFDQLKPLGAVLQHVTPKVTYTIGGTNHALHLADLADEEDVVIELTPDGTTWAWSFPDQARGSTKDVWVPPVIGWPVLHGTVAPNTSPVAFDIEYLTAAFETMRYQIMAQGITKSNASDSFHLECKGVGAEGRWDAAKVSLFRDAGHGLTAGEIIRLLLEGAENPDTGEKVISPSAILVGPEIGVPLNNPIDLDCVLAWAEARKVGDQAGHAIVAGVAGDGSATVVALPKADISSAGKFELSAERDFLKAGFRFDEVNADHPTCIVVSSNAVDTTNADGSVTATEIELVFDTFAVPGAFFSQDADSFDAIPAAQLPGQLGEPVLQLKSRRTTKTTTRGGCTDRIEVTFERYFNPIAARYIITGTPSPDLVDDVNLKRVIASIVWIQEPTATDFDSSTAYLFRYDQWSVVNYTVTHLAGPSPVAPHAGRLPEWVQEAVFPGQTEDYTFTPLPFVSGGQTITPAETTLTGLPFAIRGTDIGRQRHELTFEGGWQNPQRSLKGRVLESSPWDGQNYESGFVDASRNGVVDPSELFYADVPSAASHPIFNLSHGLVVGSNVGQNFFDHDRWLKVGLVAREFVLAGIPDQTKDGGCLTREFVADRQWSVPEGSLFLYAGGVESSVPDAEPTWRPIATEKLYTSESNVGRLTTTEYQFELNGEVSRDFPKVRIAAGFLPPMPLCNKNLELVQNLVPLRVTVCLANKDSFIGREQEITVEYIETEAGLEEYGIRLLRELTVLTVTGAIPVDARLRPWMPGVFNHVRRGYTARRCWVGSVKIPISQTPSGIETIMELTLEVPIL